jgi:hypothetical protein
VSVVCRAAAAVDAPVEGVKQGAAHLNFQRGSVFKVSELLPSRARAKGGRAHSLSPLLSSCLRRLPNPPLAWRPRNPARCGVWRHWGTSTSLATPQAEPRRLGGARQRSGQRRRRHGAFFVPSVGVWARGRGRSLLPLCLAARLLFLFLPHARPTPRSPPTTTPNNQTPPTTPPSTPKNRSAACST